MAVKNTDTTTVRLVAAGSLGTGAILVLLPFHAVFTTWLGSNFGHIDTFRIWKELAGFGLALLAVVVLVRLRQFKSFIVSDRLLWLIVAYIALQLVTAALALSAERVNNSAMIYGLLGNLRFVGFLAVVMVFARYQVWLKRHWPKLVFGPALVVIVFGLLQLVLPHNFLTHFGYGPNTIPAFQLVDQKSAYVRLQSTLRGPNPLGAYLVLVLSLAAAGWLRFKKARLNLSLLAAAGVVVLFFTYSRSAMLGLMISLFFALLLSVRSRRWQYLLCGSAVAVVLVAGGVIWTARNNDTVQNTVFHTDETSASAESSNQARADALKEGWQDIIDNPLGEGPGTAGPASTRNSQPARIAENYYLQIGQEVGLVGLLLFILINITVGIRLFVRRQSALALGLLAALLGLTVVNMLSHAWMDDTLAMLWWGLAGIAIAQPVILNKKRKHFNVRTQEETTKRSNPTH